MTPNELSRLLDACYIRPSGGPGQFWFWVFVAIVLVFLAAPILQKVVQGGVLG